MSEHLRKIQCKKKFFINYFWVSLILMILVCLCWMLFKHNIYNFISKFHDITFKELHFHIFHTMAIWRLFIIQFTLAPAIAFICLEKYVRKHDKDNDKLLDRI